VLENPPGTANTIAYQVVPEHKRSRMVIEDTGRRICQIRQNSCAPDHRVHENREMKQAFYRLLVERLSASCEISPADVIVNFVVTNDLMGWSFGAGPRAFERDL